MSFYLLLIQKQIYFESTNEIPSQNHHDHNHNKSKSILQTHE